MGTLLFVGGSAAGAALAWLIARHEPRRSAVVALVGVTCGLLGILVSIGGGVTTPVTQVGCGFLGAAAPLTLPAIFANAAHGGVGSIARRFAATLALSLMCAVGCAAVGFASGYSVRYLGHTEDAGDVVYGGGS